MAKKYVTIKREPGKQATVIYSNQTSRASPQQQASSTSAPAPAAPSAPSVSGQGLVKTKEGKIIVPGNQAVFSGRYTAEGKPIYVAQSTMSPAGISGGVIYNISPSNLLPNAPGSTPNVLRPGEVEINKQTSPGNFPKSGQATAPQPANTPAGYKPPQPSGSGDNFIKYTAQQSVDTNKALQMSISQEKGEAIIYSVRNQQPPKVQQQPKPFVPSNATISAYNPKTAPKGLINTEEGLQQYEAAQQKNKASAFIDVQTLKFGEFLGKQSGNPLVTEVAYPFILGGVDTVSSIVSHPIKTAEGAVSFVLHPIKSVENLQNQISFLSSTKGEAYTLSYLGGAASASYGISKGVEKGISYLLPAPEPPKAEAVGIKSRSERFSTPQKTVDITMQEGRIVVQSGGQATEYPFKTIGVDVTTPAAQESSYFIRGKSATVLDTGKKPMNIKTDSIGKILTEEGMSQSARLVKTSVEGVKGEQQNILLSKEFIAGKDLVKSRGATEILKVMPEQPIDQAQTSGIFVNAQEQVSQRLSMTPSGQEIDYSQYRGVALGTENADYIAHLKKDFIGTIKSGKPFGEGFDLGESGSGSPGTVFKKAAVAFNPVPIEVAKETLLKMTPQPVAKTLTIPSGIAETAAVIALPKTATITTQRQQAKTTPRVEVVSIVAQKTTPQQQKAFSFVSLTEQQQKQIFLPKTISATMQGTSSASASKQGVVSIAATKQAQSSKQITQQIQQQEQTPAQDLITETVSVQQQNRGQLFVPVVVPTPTTKPKLFSLKINNKTRSKQTSYNVMVRRKGIFSRVATAADIGQATTKGMGIVAKTAAASFKVVESTTGRVVTPRLMNKAFYSSRREPGVEIQRRRFRISSYGEKAEIPGKAKALKRLRKVFSL